VSNPILEACELHYCYPGGVVGLDDATLVLNPGEKVALLGPNGCGKTTLLLHLCGALRPQRGRLRLHGKPVEYSREGMRELRRCVGTVVQDPDDQLFAASAYQDVSFGPLNLGLSEQEVRQRVEEALASLGIEELASRPPHRLSLGQKKRVALAGVIAMRPSAILLDEPTAGLDPAGVETLLAILDRLQGLGTQITFSTHDVDLAYGWAHQIVVLRNGRVATSGAPSEVFRRRDILDEARLRSPWVVGVTESLRTAGIWPFGEAPARTAQAFLRQLANLRDEKSSNVILREADGR
jgi:cobalt/nickel transport system ATP-binding protein